MSETNVLSLEDLTEMQRRCIRLKKELETAERELRKAEIAFFPVQRELDRMQPLDATMRAFLSKPINQFRIPPEDEITYQRARNADFIASSSRDDNDSVWLTTLGRAKLEETPTKPSSLTIECWELLCLLERQTRVGFTEGELSLQPPTSTVNALLELRRLGLVMYAGGDTYEKVSYYKLTDAGAAMLKEGP